ncbi:hypothetical protein [Peptostreptococcus faecalis]|uniref:hypothetical protein n=1 Tax=Peptostreptococcus faecalis TaxID=2045015 RepID=UPI000C7D5398|nr:hypothetical protein [Peptostreptococcus faecalis]
MGQRLVINIYENKEDKKRMGNIYYHWEGFTIPGIIESIKLLKYLDGSQDIILDTLDYLHNNKKEKSNFKNSKRIVHGGLTDKQSDIDKLMELYPEIDKKYLNTECVNRNQGLLSISKADMEESDYWSEASTDIYVKDQLIDIGDMFFDDIGHTFDDSFSSEKLDIDLYDLKTIAETNQLIEKLKVVQNSDIWLLEQEDGRFVGTID